MIKTLAVKELQSRHTSEYIKRIILNVLSEYNISLKQVYSITSDNGRNMIKATKLLRMDLQLIIDSETTTSDEGSDSSDENDEQHEDARSQQSNEMFLETNIKEAEALIRIDSKSMMNVVPCAAHTTQLVVADVVKEANLAEKIAECRKLAIALKKPNNSTKISNENLRKAKLNVPTRWNSAFDMVERLLELKIFFVWFTVPMIRNLMCLMICGSLCWNTKMFSSRKVFSPKTTKMTC